MNDDRDWSAEPKDKPTRKQKARYRRWVRYLGDSRLSKQEIHRRAVEFARQGREPKP